jgi:hypothetical protein
VEFLALSQVTMQAAFIAAYRPILCAHAKETALVPCWDTEASVEMPPFDGSGTGTGFIGFTGSFEFDAVEPELSMDTGSDPQLLASLAASVAACPA